MEREVDWYGHKVKLRDDEDRLAADRSGELYAFKRGAKIVLHDTSWASRCHSYRLVMRFSPNRLPCPWETSLTRYDDLSLPDDEGDYAIVVGKKTMMYGNRRRWLTVIAFIQSSPGEGTAYERKNGRWRVKQEW